MEKGNRENPATLLVVEDDQEMLSVLRDFLEREGHRVISRSSGAGALEAMEAEPIDLVILDKQMPDVNGLDLLSLFCRQFPDRPVILITAFGGSRVADEALRRGASRYLEKPFRVTDLVTAIRAVTGSQAPVGSRGRDA